MSLVNQTKSAINHVKQAYEAVAEMGGVLPESKNLENLSSSISSIATKASLSGLQRALDNGTAQQKYPIGIQIEDTYNDEYSPLIVAQYLDGSNNSKYGGSEGVILLRKYVEPVNQQLYRNPYELDYENSVGDIFLQTTYYDLCSNNLKMIMNDLSIQASTTTISRKWFLPSVTEVYGVGGANDGSAWEYWKQVSGLTAPSNNYLSSRIRPTLQGTTGNWWLRNRGAASYASGVYNGAISRQLTALSTSGFLPACFIAKKVII